MGAPDLWSLVKREKRILYEERVAVVSATVAMAPLLQRVSEISGETGRAIALSLDRPLVENVSLGLEVNGGTASLAAEGGDATISWSVAAAGGAAANRGPCATGGCEIPFAAGQTSARLEVVVHDDDELEGEEDIEIMPRIPSAFAHLLSTETDPARVIILPSDNRALGIVADGVDTRVREGKLVHLDLFVGDPAPEGGVVVAVAVTDENGAPVTDATIPTTPPNSVTIAAGAQEARIPVRITAGHGGEPEERVRIAIVCLGGEGIGSIDPEQDSIVLTIAPNENIIVFSDESPEIVSARAAGDLVLDLGSALPAGGLSLRPESSASRIDVPSVVRIPAGATTASIPLNRTTPGPVGEEGLRVTVTVCPSAGGLPDGWASRTGNRPRTRSCCTRT